MLRFIKERLNDFDANTFINELVLASKNLGILEARIISYQFNSILIPLLHKKEAISSMKIEGTQTTMPEVLQKEIDPKSEDDKIQIEVSNHVEALLFGSDHLRYEGFSHSFIQKIHEIMMKGILPEHLLNTLGKYKRTDNRIVNSSGTVVFVPPTHSETKKYMSELIDFMNDATDDINPLIKAAIIHSQFESIHPFSDGNGRVGRLLVSLYLYKADVINFPFFYLSEAISMDKAVYYNMLTDSRNSSYNNWIKYFLKKIVVQTQKHLGYIESLNDLYAKTKRIVTERINSPKFDAIVECLFTHPIITADYLSDKLNVSRGQAIRYLNTLESEQILQGDDRKRSRKFFFVELLELAAGM